MAGRNKSRFEKWFSVSRHRKRFGAKNLSDHISLGFAAQKKVIIEGDELFNIYSEKPMTCVSKGVLDYFKTLFPAHKNSQQIYNPLNVYLITRCAGEAQVEHKNYIVHVGKFKREKWHDILIKAYAASKTDKLLVLVGQGPLESEYRSFVSQLNLNDKVIFADFHSTPYPLIKHADLLVLSSDFEGLGMVLLEALALNTPAISSDCRSGPSEILPARNLFPPRGVDALAELLSVPDFAIYNVDFPDQFNASTIAERYLAL